MTHLRSEVSPATALGGRPAADPAAVLDGVRVLLQPIVDVATGTLLAVESLARFEHAPDLPIEQVFAAAHAGGYGYALEAACLRAALDRRCDLPPGVRLAVNVSPDVLHHPMIARRWDDDLSDVIVEVTEHRANRPAALQQQFARLRRRGASIAVDDVGTGYAGLLRLATIRPDFVKIDRSVVTGVRRNDAQGAVLEALVAFSHRMGAAVIGEGVESLRDLTSLADFDVDYGQGWAIGLPSTDIVPICPAVVEACHRARVAALEPLSHLDRSATRMLEVTSAMSRATTIADLHAVTARAASELGVDVVGVSVLGPDGVLREITTSGVAIDTKPYSLADFPATQRVLGRGAIVEVHDSDPDADAAELGLLRRLGHASLLMLPFNVGDRPIGVLEFFQSRHRRWTSEDLVCGRGLAENLGHALLRLGT